MDDLSKKKNLIQNILYATSALFACAGTYALAAPQLISDFLFEGDIETGRIMGGALMFVALTDLVIAKSIFNVQDRK